MRAAAFVMVAFARPSTMGAVLPSSRHLAQAMAQAAQGAQRLVELGAGTGAITQALCDAHPTIPMLAVEMEPLLAGHLARRFPQVAVHTAAAHEVLRGLADGPAATVLVSSLPFRSLPLRWRLRSSQAIESFLLQDPAHRLVQYTYQPRAPFDLQHGDRLQWRKLALVWRNAPPAWVWELSLRPEPQPGH
jgi:phosphatidylethanolamine/phosphatidyl-N-methylethanolamine N-methyltransferase